MYARFKESMALHGIYLVDKSGQPYTSFNPKYSLFCRLPMSHGTIPALQAKVNEVLTGILGAQADPVPATMPFDEWHRKFDVAVRRMRGQVRQARNKAGDKLAVAEHIRNRNFGEALRELGLLEREGTPVADVAKQYLWAYSEQENWAGVVDTFERAGEYLEGSARSHSRAGQAYLELGLRDLKGSPRRVELLIRARARLTYGLELDQTARDPELEALLLTLLTRVDEAEGDALGACLGHLRARVLLVRHNLEGERENRRAIIRTLGGLRDAIPSPSNVELQHWFSELGPGADEMLVAAGIDPVLLATRPPLSMEPTVDFVDLLARLEVEAATSPAETGARLAQLLEREDAPTVVRHQMRLLKVRVDHDIFGISAGQYAEIQVLWQNGAAHFTRQQQCELLWYLIRHAQANKEFTAVVEYGEMLLKLGAIGDAEPGITGLNRSGELLAIMGLNAERAGEIELALGYLLRAREKRWNGKQVAEALAQIYRKRDDSERELEELLRILDEDPADIRCLERLLDLYMLQGDWVSSLKVCDQFLDQIQTPLAACEHFPVYCHRKDCLEALLLQEDQGFLERYALGVEALMEIAIEACDFEAAKAAYHQARANLVKSPWLGRLISCLEVGDADCRRLAANEMVTLALAEIDRIPRHDHEKLVDYMQRIYLLSESDYQELAHFFTDRQQKVNDDPTLRPSGGVPAAELEQVDLTGRRVAVIGAYSDVRLRVGEQLRLRGNLAELIEVPPSWEQNLDQDRIRELIRSADLIVEVPRCIKHRTTVAVSNILAIHPIPLVHAQGKGHSSIIRAVVTYFQGAAQRGV